MIKKRVGLVITQMITVMFLLGCATAQNLFAQFPQTKTIVVTPETAKIFHNGHEVGNGTYQIKFDRKTDMAVLKFEAPGYITKQVKLFKANPNKTVAFELFEDEAMQNSVGTEEGVDLANKKFTVTVKKGMEQDAIWRRLMNIAVNNFENIEVRDQAAGWIRTAWTNTPFLYQTVRTRMEIQQQFTGEGELSYSVKISSEIADKECGTNSQCFTRYDRVLRKYESVISELQTTLGGIF